MATRAYQNYYNTINVRDYGAIGDGVADDSDAIQNALNFAKTVKMDVYIPAGTYLHSKVIIVDSVTLIGSGKETVLRSTGLVEPVNSAIQLTGTFPSARNFHTTMAYAGARRGLLSDTGILASLATDFLIDNIHVHGSPSVGIMIHNSQNGTVNACTVENTLADGIHITNLSKNISITNNRTINSGDDCLGIVSYRSQGGQVQHITVANNKFEANVLSDSRGVAVVGSKFVSITNNSFVNINGAAFWAQYDSGFNTYGASNITFDSNTIDGATYLFRADGSTAYPTNSIIVSNNVATNLTFQGFNIGGGTTATRDGTYDVIVSNNIMIGNKAGAVATSYGGYIRSSSATIIGNTFKNFGNYGIVTSEAPGTGGQLKISKNHLENVTPRVIQVYDAGHDFIEVTNNTHKTAGATINTFISVGGTVPNINVFVEGNISDHATPNVYNIPTRPIYFRSKRTTERTNAPTTGTWEVGDIVWNSAPAASGFIGWVCTTAGTPGTWKTFGAITA